jgi:hypothetical protein
MSKVVATQSKAPISVFKANVFLKLYGLLKIPLLASA